jgi:HD-like signal output (HDOD) protein
MHDVGRNVVSLLVEKHKEVAPFAPVLDTAKIGSDLVHAWGLPPRIGEAILYQNHPEFTPPEAMGAGYRKEVAVLHLAHAFEGLLTGTPMDPARLPFLDECCQLLKITPRTANEAFRTKVLPNLVKSRRRLPPEIRALIPER